MTRPVRKRWPGRPIGPSGHASPASRLTVKISLRSRRTTPWRRNPSTAGNVTSAARIRLQPARWRSRGPSAMASAKDWPFPPSPAATRRRCPASAPQARRKGQRSGERARRPRRRAPPRGPPRVPRDRIRSRCGTCLKEVRPPCAPPKRASGRPAAAASRAGSGEPAAAALEEERDGRDEAVMRECGSRPVSIHAPVTGATWTPRLLVSRIPDRPHEKPFFPVENRELRPPTVAGTRAAVRAIRVRREGRPQDAGSSKMHLTLASTIVEEAAQRPSGPAAQRPSGPAAQRPFPCRLAGPPRARRPPPEARVPHGGVLRAGRPGFGASSRRTG